MTLKIHVKLNKVKNLQISLNSKNKILFLLKFIRIILFMNIHFFFYFIFSISKISCIVWSSIILWLIGVFDIDSQDSSLFVFQVEINTVSLSFSWVWNPFVKIQSSFSIKLILSNIIIIDLNFQLIGISKECESFRPFWLLASTTVCLGLELFTTNMNDTIRITLSKMILIFS